MLWDHQRLIHKVVYKEIWQAGWNENRADDSNFKDGRKFKQISKEEELNEEL